MKNLEKGFFVHVQVDIKCKYEKIALTNRF